MEKILKKNLILRLNYLEWGSALLLIFPFPVLNLSGEIVEIFFNDLLAFILIREPKLNPAHLQTLRIDVGGR